MKKKGIDKGFVIALMYPLGVIVVILGFLAVRGVEEKDATAYWLVCLNSDKNTGGDNEAYFYGDDRETYRYDFETGVTEQLCQLDFEAGCSGVVDKRFEFAVYEDYGFYLDGHRIDENCALHRYNYRTKEDEILLEDIGYVYGINICNGYLIYRPTYSEYFLYPATAAAGEEPIDLAGIFEREGDKTNSDIQTVTYEGMDIAGDFDSTTGEVMGIISVKEHGTGKVLVPSEQHFVLNDGRRLVFSADRWTGDAPQYYADIYDDSDDSKYEITCLAGKDIDENSEFFEKFMTQEGDEVICLLQISYKYGGKVMWQVHSGGDILFKWNIKTGESSILYETLRRDTRIVGYKNGNIYLLHNNWVSVQPVNGGKRKKLFKIPKGREIYYFDWQGDYLIVTDIYRKNEVLAAYKIE